MKFLLSIAALFGFGAVLADNAPLICSQAACSASYATFAGAVVKDDPVEPEPAVPTITTYGDALKHVASTGEDVAIWVYDSTKGHLPARDMVSVDVSKFSRAFQSAFYVNQKGPYPAILTNKDGSPWVVHETDAVKSSSQSEEPTSTVEPTGSDQ